MAIIGCILLVNADVGTIDEVQGKDIGPHQIWVMSFGILFLYFNIVSVSLHLYIQNPRQPSLFTTY